jgi:hypothetical protein
MAYPKARSVNEELLEGMTDGRYKKIITDRGGVVETTFVQERRDLSKGRYGIGETAEKTTGDCRTVRTPLSFEIDPEGLGS